jgi:hypothetical protein
MLFSIIINLNVLDTRGTIPSFSIFCQRSSKLLTFSWIWGGGALKQTCYINYILKFSKAKDKRNSWIGAVKGAVKGNFGAVKGPEGAAVLAKSSREGLVGPGNPGGD